MNRTAPVVVVAVLALCGSASAQSATRRPPTVSPYLNLAAARFNPAVAYYGIVRPQLEFRGALQAIDQRVTAAEQPTAPDDGELPPTGQRAQFMTHTRYFQNTGLPPAAVRGSGSAAAPAAPRRATPQARRQ